MDAFILTLADLIKNHEKFAQIFDQKSFFHLKILFWRTRFNLFLNEKIKLKRHLVCSKCRVSLFFPLIDIKAISLTPLYHFHSQQRQLVISRAITAESSPLHIASSRTRTGNIYSILYSSNEGVGKITFLQTFKA